MEYDERTWSEWKIDLHLPLNIKYPKNCVYFFLHMHNAIIIITKREVNALFSVCSYRCIWIGGIYARKKKISSELYFRLYLNSFSIVRVLVSFFSWLLKKNREMKFLSLKIRIVCTNCGVFFSLLCLFRSPHCNSCRATTSVRECIARFFFGYCNKKSNFAVLFGSIQTKTFQYFAIAPRFCHHLFFSLFSNPTFVLEIQNVSSSDVKFFFSVFLLLSNVELCNLLLVSMHELLNPTKNRQFAY